jgi:lipopolysaccharide transport system ATP-binding protein
VGFYLKDGLGQNLFGDNTYLTTVKEPFRVQAGHSFRARFRFEMPRLRSGDYFITAGVADGGRDEHDIQHWIHEALLLHSRCEAWSIGILGLPMHSIEIEEFQ